MGCFAGAGLGRDAFGWPLLLADNYNRVTTGHHRGTERTEDAQRLFLAKVSGPVSGLPILAGCGQQRPAAPRPCRILAGVPACARGRRLWAGPSGIAAMSSGRAGLPGKRSCSGAGGRLGRDAGSREGAKPRSSDERRTIFRQGPRAAPVEPFLDKGHSGRQSSSARRARLPGKRSGAQEADRAEITDFTRRREAAKFR